MNGWIHQYEPKIEFKIFELFRYSLELDYKEVQSLKNINVIMLTLPLWNRFSQFLLELKKISLHFLWHLKWRSKTYFKAVTKNDIV